MAIANRWLYSMHADYIQEVLDSNPDVLIECTVMK